MLIKIRKPQVYAKVTVLVYFDPFIPSLPHVTHHEYYLPFPRISNLGRSCEFLLFAPPPYSSTPLPPTISIIRGAINHISAAPSSPQTPPQCGQGLSSVLCWGCASVYRRFLWFVWFTPSFVCWGFALTNLKKCLDWKWKMHVKTCWPLQLIYRKYLKFQMSLK